MRLNLQLLTKFRLSHADSDEPIAMRSNGRILAYLAWKGDEAVDRKELMKVLWPEEQSSVAANRLRVALARLRATLGDVMVETPHGLSLDWKQVACDIHDAKEAERDSRSSVTASDELEALTPLLPRLSQTIFELEDEAWQQEAQSEWQNWAGSLCLHIADLAHMLGEQVLAEKAVDAGLQHLPYEPKLRVHHLRLAEAAGRGNEAIKQLHAAQKIQPIHDAAVNQWVEQIQRSQTEDYHPERPLSPDQLEFAGSLIEVLIEKQPELARQVLGSPETRVSAGRNPRLMHSLLLKVIENPVEYDIHWEKCVARTIGLKAWLNDYEGVLQLSPILLARTNEPPIKRAVWNAVSMAKSLIRDWQGALEAIEETIRLAEELGSELDICSSIGTKATCLWLQSRYEDAEKLYAETLSRLAAINSEKAEFDRLVCLGNRAFIPVMQGNFAKGRAWLEDSLAQRDASGLEVSSGLQNSCLAMTKALLGEREGLGLLMHKGLQEAFQSESERFRLLALEFCAGALIALGESSLGWSILTQAEAWRKDINHTRAPAELELIENLLDRVPARARRHVLPLGITPAKVGKMAVQKLAVLTSS